MVNNVQQTVGSADRCVAAVQWVEFRPIKNRLVEIRRAGWQFFRFVSTKAAHEYADTKVVNGQICRL